MYRCTCTDHAHMIHHSRHYTYSTYPHTCRCTHTHHMYTYHTHDPLQQAYCTHTAHTHTHVPMHTHSTCTYDLQQHTLHIYSTYPHTRVDTHVPHAHPQALQTLLTWAGALSKHYLLTGLGLWHLQLVPFSSFFDLEWLETWKVFPGKKMEKLVCLSCSCSATGRHLNRCLARPRQPWDSSGVCGANEFCRLLGL